MQNGFSLQRNRFLFRAVRSCYTLEYKKKPSTAPYVYNTNYFDISVIIRCIHIYLEDWKTLKTSKLNIENGIILEKKVKVIIPIW